MKNFQVMVFNGMVLLLLGMFGFFFPEQPVKDFVFFINPFAGFLLIMLSFPASKEKALWAHIAIFITLITVILSFYQGFKTINTTTVACGVVSLLSFFFYISDFFKRKSERQNQKNNEL